MFSPISSNIIRLLAKPSELSNNFKSSFFFFFRFFSFFFKHFRSSLSVDWFRFLIVFGVVYGCPLLVLGCHQILKKKKTEQNRTTAKKTMHKSAWSPPTPIQSTPGQKQSPKKPKPNACAEHLRGQGEQNGAKNRHRQKEPSHP